MMVAHRRLFLAIGLTACLAMLLACGGGGTNTPKPPSVAADKPAKPDQPPKENNARDWTAEDQATIEDATKQQKAALAKQEQVRATNEELRQQYDQGEAGEHG